MPISGYRTVVDNLVRLHEVGTGALGPDRAVNLPALEMTPPEMTQALLTAADRPLGPVRYHLDPAVVAVFRGWPQHWSSERANALGPSATPAPRPLSGPIWPTSPARTVPAERRNLDDRRRDDIARHEHSTRGDRQWGRAI